MQKKEKLEGMQKREDTFVITLDMQQDLIRAIWDDVRKQYNIKDEEPQLQENYKIMLAEGFTRALKVVSEISSGLLSLDDLMSGKI